MSRFLKITGTLFFLALGSITAYAAEERSAPARLPSLTVLSIIPAQGEPGMTVTLNGGGFTEKTTAFLGATEVKSTPLGDKAFSLLIPDLPPGVYALYLKREDGVNSRPYNFAVQPLHPSVTTLTPDHIDACSAGREREVTVNGSNFRKGAQVVLDGGGIGTRFISTEAVAFVTPQLPPGLHQVLVKNASGASSEPLALIVDSKPEIATVAIGGNFVSYYEMVVTGRNFQQGSTLVVNGNRVGTGQPAVGDRDNLVFVGCSQIIYQRHPYDMAPKELRMQIVNPNGEESGVVLITAP